VLARHGPPETLVSDSTYAAITESPEFVAASLRLLAVKGKLGPVPVYDAGPAPVTDRRAVVRTA